jgi:hypothetical protein
VAQTLIVSGLPNSSFYAPTFRILVEGTKLDEPTLREILDLKVVMDMENLTSFDFTIANPWHYRQGRDVGGTEEATFKYSDTTPSTSGAGSTSTWATRTGCSR